MNLSQLRKFLQKKYNIISLTDISDLSNAPNAAYKFFHNIYKTSYSKDDRIILYTVHDIQEEFLRHLYKTVNFLGIGNFFIVLCTPRNYDYLLRSCADKFSEDKQPFSNFVISLDKSLPIESKFTLPDTICAVPWTNIEIRNNGKIHDCCMARSDPVGDIKNTSIKDAFNNSKMQELRKRFLSGEKPKECIACWANEDRGLSSIRTHNISRLKNKFLLHTLDNPQITSLDIKFNNTCNFKCRICNPTFSSMYAAEQNKVLNIPIKPQIKWEESEEFLNQVIEILPQLENIDMFGGEPFLIKKFANVLKIAVEQGFAKKIRLHYNSNGSIWPKEFLQYWPNFREVDIHFSIDAIGKRFEFQRGGSWQEVENNILGLKNLKLSNLNISIMPTINIMSIYYIDEVYDWAGKHNFQLFASNLTGPEEFSLDSLTEIAKQKIIEKYKNHPWIELQKIIKYIDKNPASTNQSFLQKSQWFDNIRNQNFADSHPEMASYMGY